MLIEFSVENYRSIAERQTLSMVASSERNLKDSNTFQVAGSEKLRLLKSAVIYGANASGKTNILKGLDILKYLVMFSATSLQVNDKLNVEPFKLDLEWIQKPTSFEVIFIQDNIRYQYFVSLDRKRIYTESLYAYPSGRSQCWYERNYDKETDQYNWYFGNQLKGQKTVISKLVRPNSLFLSHAAQNNHQQLSSVFNWFYEKLDNFDFHINLRNKISDQNPEFWKELTAEICYENQPFKDLITSFLIKADIDIEGLKIQKVDKSIDSHEHKQTILDKEDYIIKTLRHLKNSDQLIEFDLKDESNGTQRLFEIAGFLLCGLSGRIIIVDELAKSLHPAVSISITQLFNSQTNNEGGQLIFNTHDTILLDKNIFRRDQIWFTEKNKDRATELYSLSQFKPIKNESLQKGYLQGRYGAIPFIGNFQF